MKANRAAVHRDEAVSPVIATILMVAITVVLAATVYLFVTGFNAGPGVVTASFAAQAVDMPLGTRDADTSDDVIEITYVSGAGDLSASDVTLTVDGVSLTWNAADDNFYQGGAFTATTVQLCTSSPGGDADDTWERGGSLYLMKVSATATASDCDGANALGDYATGVNAFTGMHLLKVAARNQVVFDGQVEVHDDAST